MPATAVGIIVNGTFEVDPHDQSRMLGLIREHLEETRRTTAGCAYYYLAVNMERPSLIHLIEGWQDQASLDAHLASPQLQAARARMGAIAMKNYQTFIYEVKGQSQYHRDDL